MRRQVASSTEDAAEGSVEEEAGAWSEIKDQAVLEFVLEESQSCMEQRKMLVSSVHGFLIRIAGVFRFFTLIKRFSIWPMILFGSFF